MFLKVNSVKDLRLLLEEDGLSAHYGDNKMSSAEEQPLNPTPKEQSLAEKICPLVGSRSEYFDTVTHPDVGPSLYAVFFSTSQCI